MKTDDAFALKYLLPPPWVLLAVAMFIFLTPNVDLAWNLQWHDGQRLAQLVLLAVVVLAPVRYVTVRSLTDTWLLLPRWSLNTLLGAFALGLVSSLMAALPRWALLEWAMLWLLLIMALAIAAERCRMGERMDRLLVILFFATAMAYTISVSAVYIGMLLVGSGYGQVFNVRELYVSFSNLRFFGHIQTMLLPFLLLPAMWWGTTRIRLVMLWSIPALWWMLAIASGTRGTWVALLVGIIAAAIYGGRIGRRWIQWQFGGLACGGLCYGAFIWAIPQLIEQPVLFMHRTADIISLSLREEIWAAAKDFTLHHPVLGVGPMHFAYFANKIAAHPHNAVLQWFAEWGIPAALMLTGVCAVAGLTFASHVRREVERVAEHQGLMAVALLAALGGAAAQAMVDGVLVMPVSQTLLALLCGWAMGRYFYSREVQCSASQRVIVMLVTLIAAGALVLGVVPEIGHIAEREKAYLAAHPPDTLLLPRFWTQGWINE